MAHEQWQLDTVHSSITFSIRHMVIAKVHGRFGRWSGTLQLDETALHVSRLELQIDAASIDTNEAQRDQHLRSADFFDVEKFPHITFVSTRLELHGDDRFRLFGNMTMHGVTREAVFDVEQTGRIKDPWGNDRRGFAAKGVLSRKDFGLTYNQVLEAGGLALGDAVDVAIEIEAFKPAAAAVE